MLLRLVIRIVVVSVTVVWTTVVGSWSLAQGGGEAKRTIEVKNGTLSVDLPDVAMMDVLITIGEQAGVKVTIVGTLGNVKAQAFKMPLEEGIKKLAETSDVDLIMIYGPGRRLAEVRAYKWPLGPPPVAPPLRIPIPGVQSLPAQHK